MSERLDEGIITGAVDPVTIKQTEAILTQMKSSICKIKGKLTGTGYFCCINYENKNIPCLMTNYHILDKEYIKKNNPIKINLNDNDINEKIKINEEDIIYQSKKDEYDLIIIKLKEGQKYMKFINYLNIDDKLFNENSENGYESIYILHYPNAQNAAVSYGNGIIFDDEYKYDLKHGCHTLEGSSGGPILNLLTNKVIGIHKGCIQKKDGNKYNIGTFLKYPLDEIKNKTNSLEEMKNKTKSSKLFFTLEEYTSGKYLSFHKKILFYYDNQNNKNFEIAMNGLKDYLNKNCIKIEYFRFKSLKILESFKNLEENYKEIIREYNNNDGIYPFMNYILWENDVILLEKFSYFIAGFLKSLDIAANKFDFIEKKNRLSWSIDIPVIPFEELIIFKENIGKIISFKHFLVTTRNRNVAECFLRTKKPNLYNVLFIINYEYNEYIDFDCFNYSKLSHFPGESERLFRIFSFFLVKDIVIYEEKRRAEICLNSIGKQKEFEIKIRNLTNEKIRFNNKKNILEIS